jgi:hypothetical protein
MNFTKEKDMKKKVLMVALAIAIVLCGLAVTRHVGAQAAGSKISRAVGFYDSVQYAQWGMYVLAGNSATGSQTITVCPAFQALPDGRLIQPLAPANTVFSPFTIDPQGSTSETLTPTAYSLVTSTNGGVQCANVTASFSNTHAGGSLNTSQVISGDQGIQEAINDASLNNGGMVRWVIDPGIVTLSTGGANTTLGSVAIPTRSVVLSASARVTTTIATCAGGWSLGFSTGTEFGSANTTLTAGTTTDSSTIALPTVMTAAATIPINKCTTSNASAGAIHPHFEGYKVVAPAQ